MIQIKSGYQLVIMVDEKTVKKYFIKLFLGLIIYFAIINIWIYFEYGIPFTPREWLLNPLFNLFIKPNSIAWLIFIVCELIGLVLFETREE